MSKRKYFLAKFIEVEEDNTEGDDHWDEQSQVYDLMKDICEKHNNILFDNVFVFEDGDLKNVITIVNKNNK